MNSSLESGEQLSAQLLLSLDAAVPFSKLQEEHFAADRNRRLRYSTALSSKVDDIHQQKGSQDVQQVHKLVTFRHKSRAASASKPME